MFNWGIIGCGNIARKFIEATADMTDIRVFGLSSRNPENARNMAEKYGIAEAYSSVEAMLQDPRIQAVYIATTNHTHLPLVKASLMAGKPVLCEKPFMVNATEAAEAIALARERKLFLMEALWTKCLPIYRQLQSIVAEGKIGDIRAIRSEYFYQMPDHIAPRLLTTEPGGGATLDIGIYGLTFVSMFLGVQPEKITSVAVFSDAGVDMQSVINLKYPGDALVTVHSCINAPAPLLAVVFGSKGRIEIPEFSRAQHATVYYYGTDFSALRQGPTVVGNVPPGGETVEIDSPFRVNGFEYQIEAATAAIQAGETECTLATLDDTLGLAKMLDAARECWRQPLA